MKTIEEVKVGDLVRFAEEKNPYRVRARGPRYLVCTKPFAPKKTVIYTVVDLQDGIRGTENLVLGAGAETDKQCAEMCDRLEGVDRECQTEHSSFFQTEVSRRNRIPLNVISVK